MAVLALFLWCALSYAQTGYTGPRAYDPNTPTHTVSGSVVNSATGEPIPRALVQIMGPLQKADLTDSQGSFRFEGVPEGRAVFMVRKPGFFSSNEMSLGGGRPRGGLTVSGDMASLVLKLTPEGIVHGTITGEDGEPLEHVQVRLKRQVVINGRKQWNQGAGAQTDENGEFRAANLVPGTYYMVAEAQRPFTPRAAAVNIGYPATYFPGVPDLSAASPIDVRGGQSTELDLRLRAQPLHEVAGIVTGLTPGNPRENVRVQFTNRSGDVVPANLRFNPQDGSFTARVPAGTYTAHAASNEPRLQASVTVTIAANLNVRLALQPAATIPVIVRSDFTKQQSSGISNAGLKTSTAPQVSVQLTPVDSFTSGAYSTIDQNSASIMVRNVEPGRYRVQIMPHGPWYVQSATLGQTDVLREELVIGQGGEQRPIEVVLRDDGGSINGAVTSDNNPVPAVVLVVPERRATPPQTQYTSERGFTLTNLAPGDYMLLAFDSVDGLEYDTREALGPYSSQAAHVSVNSNGSANVTLTLIKRGEP